jgi:phosphoenolpyruvate carboxylase
MPPSVHNGRIRFTEQGEVISFRYGMADIARRHLEQIVSAVIRTVAPGVGASAESVGQADDGSAEALVERIAEESMAAYRGLIDADGFWEWYTTATPIEQISRLPIASRPVSRGSAADVSFDDLRAIPWVFAWTQVRYTVPGWYGTGRALEAVLGDGTEARERLARCYREWEFLRATVDSAQREMSRARLPIAREYDELVASGEPDGSRFHELIEEDYAAARRGILAITDQDELLENDPVIRRSIQLRNPYTDVLNLLQLELLRRSRAGGGGGETLRQALFLSINGIAAAMQSTG